LDDIVKEFCSLYCIATDLEVGFEVSSQDDTQNVYIGYFEDLKVIFAARDAEMDSLWWQCALPFLKLASSSIHIERPFGELECWRMTMQLAS